MADGCALEDGRQHEGDAHQDVEDGGRPEQALDGARGEDAQEEEEQGELEHGDVEEVQDLHDVEVLYELGDGVEGERPDVLPQTVLDGAEILDNGRGHGADEGDEDHVVVQS